jgi:hypothetical protein
MALDFPASPVNGQVSGNYKYNSSIGAWQGIPQTQSVATVSSSVPISANNGDIWYNSASGVAYVYYKDGTSNQWIELISAAPASINSIGDVTDVSIINPLDDQVLSYDYINSQWTNTTIDISATTVSDTAPTTPAPSQGDGWFDSSSGYLYVYYNDGNGTGQWVEVKANSADAGALAARVSTLETKADFPIQLNTQTISANYTIPSGYNGMSAGPITIANNVVVTIPDGSSWSIV